MVQKLQAIWSYLGLIHDGAPEMKNASMKTAWTKDLVILNEYLAEAPS